MLCRTININHLRNPKQKCLYFWRGLSLCCEIPIISTCAHLRIWRRGSFWCAVTISSQLKLFQRNGVDYLMFDHLFKTNKLSNWQYKHNNTFLASSASFGFFPWTFFAQDLGIQITRCWRIISTGGFIQRRSVHAPGGEGSQNQQGRLKPENLHMIGRLEKKSSKTSKSLGFLCFVFGGCAWLCSEKAQSQPQVGRTFLCNQLFGEVNHFVSMVPYTSTYSISKDHKHRVYLPLKHFCIVFILEPPWALWLPNDIGGSIAAHLSMSKSETKTIGFISLPRVLKWFQFPLAPKPPFARVLPLRKGDPHKRPMPNLNQSRLAEPRTENQGH